MRPEPTYRKQPIKASSELPRQLKEIFEREAEQIWKPRNLIRLLMEPSFCINAWKEVYPDSIERSIYDIITIRSSWYLPDETTVIFNCFFLYNSMTRQWEMLHLWKGLYQGLHTSSQKEFASDVDPFCLRNPYMDSRPRWGTDKYPIIEWGIEY